MREIGWSQEEIDAYNALKAYKSLYKKGNPNSIQYLNWLVLSARHQVVGTGIIKKAGESASWGTSDNTSVSNQTLTVGKRLVWEVSGVLTKNFLVGLSSTTPLDIRNSAGAPFGIEIAAFVGAYGRENGANAPATPVVSFGTLVDGSLLAIHYFNSTTIKYEYSINGGTTWIEWYTSTNIPSGSYNVQIQIYGPNDGADSIFII